MPLKTLLLCEDDIGVLLLNFNKLLFSKCIIMMVVMVMMVENTVYKYQSHVVNKT